MSKQYIRPGDRLLASMTTPENPELNVLEDLIFATALLDEDDRNDHALGGLLSAYCGVLDFEWEPDEEPEPDLINDGPSHNYHYAAENLYKTYVLAGYRSRGNVAKDAADDDLYDYVTWFTFPSGWTWPTALLARVAYARGIRDALECEQMARYFAEHAKEYERSVLR